MRSDAYDPVKTTPCLLKMRVWRSFFYRPDQSPKDPTSCSRNEFRIGFYLTFPGPPPTLDPPSDFDLECFYLYCLPAYLFNAALLPTHLT
nr:hypothetical protein Q903MT_gene365 [Picea sitchensis]